VSAVLRNPARSLRVLCVGAKICVSTTELTKLSIYLSLFLTLVHSSPPLQIATYCTQFQCQQSNYLHKQHKQNSITSNIISPVPFRLASMNNNTSSQEQTNNSNHTKQQKNNNNTRQDESQQEQHQHSRGSDDGNASSASQSSRRGGVGRGGGRGSSAYARNRSGSGSGSGSGSFGGSGSGGGAGRGGNKSNKSKQKQSQNINGMVNFHHTDMSTRRRELLSANSRPTRDPGNNRAKPRTAKEEESLRQERRARDKHASAFYLQSSAHHSFVLKRDHDFVVKNMMLGTDKNQVPAGKHKHGHHGHGKSHHGHAHGHTKHDTITSSPKKVNPIPNPVDLAVPWDAIELVKVMVEVQTTGGAHAHSHAHAQSQLSCPVCLSDFVAPRMIPCGHTFCLSCMLHHWYTSTSTSEVAHFVKCPCCSVEISSLNQLRPVRFTSVTPPQTNMQMQTNHKHKMTFQKLYSLKKGGTAGISSTMTSRHVIVPGRNMDTNDTTVVAKAMASSSDPDARFYRFTVQDTTPSAFMGLLEQELQLIMVELHDLREQSQIFKLHGKKVAFQACDSELSYCQMAQDMVQHQYNQVLQMVQNAPVAVPVAAVKKKAIRSAVAINDGNVNVAVASKSTEVARASQAHWSDDDNDNHGDGETQKHDGGSTGSTSTALLNNDNASADAGTGTAQVTEHWDEEKQEQTLGNSAVADHDYFDRHRQAEERTVTRQVDDGNGVSYYPTSMGGEKTSSTSAANAKETSIKQEAPPAAPPSKNTSSSITGTSASTSASPFQAFYQSADGQLCFLSGFNMACLRYEAELKQQEQKQSSQDVQDGNEDNIHLLPDTIEAQVVDVEQVHVTPLTRNQRLQFLQYHVPLYASVALVELNLFSSEKFLSPQTKAKFHDEHEKRLKKRKSKKQAEKKLDKEMERHDLKKQMELHKSRPARPDFENDTFFHVSAATELVADPALPLTEEFGPALSMSSPSRSSPRLVAVAAPPPAAAIYGGGYNNQVTTASQGYFPDLATSMAAPARNKKAAPPPSPPTSSVNVKRGSGGGAWGASQPQATPSAAVGASWNQVPSSSLEPSINNNNNNGSKKKGGRGKKVLLFSTGGGGGRK
jgi:hypothetical protein